MTTFAPVTNFAYALLDGGITAVATSFSVVSGGSKFPLPSMDGNFNATIWNVTDYEFAHLDPNAEIVTVTGRSTNAFTVTRGAESTSAVAHNTTGKTYAIALTFSKSSYDTITSSINERGVLLGGNTWTGINAFDEVTANKVRAVGSGGLLLEANNGTDVALFGAGGSSGVTFYGGVNIAGSFAFTGTGVSTLSTNSSDGSDSKAITIAGGGAYGPTRGSGIAVIGNEYATIGGDLELMAGDSAISGAIKHYVGNGAGGAYLAVKTDRTTGLTNFYGGIDCLALTQLRYAVTIGGNATSDAVGLEIGNTAGGTPYIDFKSSAVDYNVRIINGTSTTLSFLGATGGYFFDTTVNSIYAKVATTANATLTTITQGLTIAGNLVTSAYVADGYTAGLTWSSTDDNVSKPKAGVFSKTTGAGTYLYFGTSNSYVTGITTSSSIGPNGELEIGSITSAGKIQVGSTAPTQSQGSALTVNSNITTGAAGSGSIIVQGEANKERIKIYSAGGSGTGSPLINLFSFRGSIASPSATQLGDVIAGVSGGGYGATTFSGNQYVFFQHASENWTDSAMGTYTSFKSVPNGTTGAVDRILIANDGTITFGSAFSIGTGALYAGTAVFTTASTSLTGISLTHSGVIAGGQDGVLINCTGANTNANSSALYVLQSNASSTQITARFTNLGSSHAVSLISAGGATLLSTQNTVTSTNFVKHFQWTKVGGGVVTLWISNGTDPNGVLSGTAGDVCFNCNSSLIKKCTGTTNWS